MATTQFSAYGRSRQVDRRAVAGVVVAGLVAGMMMGMVEMIIEAVGGHGFWSPLRYIASVFTRGADTDPSFALGPVAIGLMGHIMNGVILTAVFAAVVWNLRNPATLVVAGMMWGAIVFAVMWWVVVPAIDPAVTLLNGTGFFITHLIVGMIAGLGVAAAQRWTLTPQYATR